MFDETAVNAQTNKSRSQPDFVHGAGAHDTHEFQVLKKVDLLMAGLAEVYGPTVFDDPTFKKFILMAIKSVPAESNVLNRVVEKFKTEGALLASSEANGGTAEASSVAKSSGPNSLAEVKNRVATIFRECGITIDDQGKITFDKEHHPHPRTKKP